MLKVFAFWLIIILSFIGSICTQYVWSESGIAVAVKSFFLDECPISDLSD
jgi:hypothetical protein